jgi:hypothetical protein
MQVNKDACAKEFASLQQCIKATVSGQLDEAASQSALGLCHSSPPTGALDFVSKPCTGQAWQALTAHHSSTMYDSW